MKAKYSSREAQAVAEIGHTAISLRLARLLTAVFLLAIGAVPLVQQAADILAWRAGRRASPVPQCYDIFRKPPDVAEALTRAGMPLAKRITAANRAFMRTMRAYEDRLENDSVIGGGVRSPTQYILVRWLGAGNDKTYCGRGQWLFYRPDIDYVINRGFLRTDIMARRVASAKETATAPQPDPRPAILAFNAELAARGIKLILMPTPVKPVVHPEKFTAAFEDFTNPVHNASYEVFIGDMQKAGISVFDASRALVQAKHKSQRDQFLAGDTHWRPEAMELCARLLGDFARQHANLAAKPAAGYTAARTNVLQRGDIVAMLRLPERSAPYGQESATIRQIFEPDGQAWQPRREADILVLGDSFANIYSLEAMRWGSSAGFCEQLSYEMQRSVDRLAVNDNGSWATRDLLGKEMLRGDNRLSGKRVVIWQFAERELSEGDWKILSARESVKPAAFLELPAGTELRITGRIKAITRAPRPYSVPYADHIIAAQLVDVTDGATQYGQALVYLRSMTKHVHTPAAGLKPGDKVSLSLRPWSEVSAQYERINRTDLDDPELLAQEPAWGEIVPGTSSR